MGLWGCGLFAPLMQTVDGTRSDSFVSFSVSLLGDIDWSQFKWGEFIEHAGGFFVLLIWAIILAPISLLAALVLNVLGWLKNDAKKTLVAGIVYIVSGTIPSAILCFIGWAKLKKQQA